MPKVRKTPKISSKNHQIAQKRPESLSRILDVLARGVQEKLKEKLGDISPDIASFLRGNLEKLR